MSNLRKRFYRAWLAFKGQYPYQDSEWKRADTFDGSILTVWIATSNALLDGLDDDDWQKPYIAQVISEDAAKRALHASKKRLNLA